MSHAEKILGAAYNLYMLGRTPFSRNDVRNALGTKREEWESSFNPIFQAMRIDQPGGAPGVAAIMKNTLRRIDRGIYVLTEYGIHQGRTLASGYFHKPLQITEESKPNLTQESENSRNVFAPQHSSPMSQIYSTKVENILSNIERYHQAFYRSEVFGNPCLYFHRKALETNREPRSEKHLEYVYATLIAWGMNRLGKKGSKMVDFEIFAGSIRHLNDDIEQAQAFRCENLDDMKWGIVERIFKGIRVMDTRTSLVGNSKVMHHMLPNLIPPIDRQYTLSYLRGNTNIRNGLNGEWNLMKAIISSFFIPIANNPEFQTSANAWMSNVSGFPWDTSHMKIIDNLLIGGMKSKM